MATGLLQEAAGGREMSGGTDVAFRWDVVAAGDEGPGPRSRHCLVYDAGARATVLFGGIVWIGEGSLRADTWELRGGRWSPVECDEHPPARHRGAMTYDASRGHAVLFGGHSWLNGFFRDTWTYAQGSWRRWRAGWWGRQPSPRCGHCMAYDEEIGAVVLFGGIDPSDRPLGDTWLFDGAAWKPVSGKAPEARRYAAFAYHAGLKGCVLHGGAEDDRGRRTFGDAWLFRAGVWTRMAGGFDTDARDDHGMAYHRAARRLVMLEGVAGARGLLVQGAHGWRTAAVEPLHPRHQCSPLTWDDTLAGLVLHGGEFHHGGPQLDVTQVLRLSG